jgi:hypothetical protein
MTEPHSPHRISVISSQCDETMELAIRVFEFSQDLGKNGLPPIT